MKINNLNLTLFNIYNTRNKINTNSVSNNIFINVTENINNLILKRNTINATGTYNNMGKISTTQAPTLDVWESNGEKLTDNNSSNYIGRPESLKESLNDLPENLKYKGKLTSVEIAEKYATTGEMTPQESYYLNIVNPTAFCDAHMKAQVPLAGKEIENALKANNITLNQDEELKINVSSTNKITVSGIDDPERAQKIQEALQTYNLKSSVPQSLAAILNGATVCGSQTINKLSPEVRGLINSTLTATDFLYNETGGKISFDDITIKDNIIEGLPSDLDTLLNGTIDKNAEINGTYVSGIKSCIMKIKSYEDKYGKENLPIVTSNFTYKNGSLSIVEDAELSRKAISFKKKTFS